MFEPEGADGCALAYSATGSGPAMAVIHGGFATLGGRLSGATHARPDHGPPHPDDFELAKIFRLLKYDRRGCYRSETVVRGYELENQARDLKALLDHEGITTTHVVGSSSGGPVAIVFASMFGAATASLSLVGTAAFLFPPHPLTDAIRHGLHVLDTEGPLEAFHRRLDGIEVSYEPLWRRDEMAARGEMHAWEEANRVAAERARELSLEQRAWFHAAELESFRPYLETDLSDMAATLNVPTLVLHGTADREVPVEWGRQLAATIPSATLVEIPNGHHGLFWRDSRGRQTVVDFITSL